MVNYVEHFRLTLKPLRSALPIAGPAFAFVLMLMINHFT